MLKCSNCVKKDTLQLNQTSDRAVMSDGSFANDFGATQSLCRSCGCIFITYQPSNRLEKYFSEEYDVSDEIQNCQVVVSGNRQGKHSLIHNSLLDSCAGLPSHGRFLEIACGNGTLSEKFAEAHPNWECLAIDPSNQSARNRYEKVHFIHDFFDPALFQGESFDVIVAHGILNRTAPMEMLRGIASIANQNALISIEIVTLENSIFAPYIWDHCYTFLEEVFVGYLNSCGMTVDHRVDCGPTIQFICRFDKEMAIGNNAGFPETVDSSLSLYQDHIAKWELIKNNFLLALARNEGKKIALFGAGLYNAVLINILKEPKFDFVIDEVRAGRFFEGIEIISLDDAVRSEEAMVVFLCSRPSNLDYINEKLENKGFLVESLL
ncbi:class I SAM-dependent methyltransferase [Verrucomicrobia bacterium]|nr:class I SAM-dependent methyltransferase [Verrucomicrobiota bacterium]